MASSSFEANADSLPSSMVLLRCNHGSEMETPFTDKTIMKRKVKAKIPQLLLAIGRHMTMKKVHIKENDWSLLLFFEPVQEAVPAVVVDLMKSWVGIQGSVRYFVRLSNRNSDNPRHAVEKWKRNITKQPWCSWPNNKFLVTLTYDAETPADGSGPVTKKQKPQFIIGFSMFQECTVPVRKISMVLQ